MDNSMSCVAFIIVVLAIVYLPVYLRRNNCSELRLSSVQQVYDYVIIGGGSAGSVLGSRLSENGNVSVLILEAGDHYDNIAGIHGPAMASLLQHTRADWDYISSSNSEFLGHDKQKHFITSGRVLGGSSAINYNIFVRGSPYHFDEWVTDYGCEGWGYKDLLPYFKKCESTQIQKLKLSEYHNVNGPIAISELQVSSLYKIFATAAKQLGYDEVDYNGQNQSGFGSIQYSIRNGVRSSTGLEYLNDEILRHRPNIDIAVNSIVTNIHIKHKIAKGVYFINDGRKRYVEARREVIVAAGALNSPQLLMLSGIGPKAHLKQLGIPVAANLPVGKRLDNHVGVIIHAKVNASSQDVKGVLSKIQTALFDTRPLTYAPFVMQGFLHSDKSTIGKEKPNLQMVFTQNIFDYTGAVNYDPNVAKEMRKSIQNSTGFSAFIFLSQPKSTGSVKLQTTDPFDSPIYNINQLAEVEDIKMLVKGIRLFENLTATDALKAIGADLNINKYYFCSGHQFRSDGFWECILRHAGFIAHHYSSTCRMGPALNSSAVVDLSLKVIGIDNLRVCDAFVFPSITTGNTFAPTIALAEKAADIIKSQL